MSLPQGLYITIFDFLETLNDIYLFIYFFFFQIGVFDARNMNLVITDDIQCP